MEESETYWLKAHYLDASALVKLVAEDPDEEQGREVLRKYYWRHPSSMYTTSYCFAEALSALKAKWLRRKITEEQYIEHIRDFVRQIVGANLRIDEVPILSVVGHAERLMAAHGIDFLDAFQIVTIINGQFKRLGPNSKTILITADHNLIRAARAEGVKVWDCTKEPAPDQIALRAAG